MRMSLVHRRLREGLRSIEDLGRFSVHRKYGEGVLSMEKLEVFGPLNTFRRYSAQKRPEKVRRPIKDLEKVFDP